MANKDIFEPKSAIDWQEDPDHAFDAWLTTLRGRRKGATQLKVSSAEIYKLQWSKFLAFLSEKRIEVTEVSAKDVTEFLSMLADTNSSQRERYRALLERVFRHLYSRDRTYNDRLNPASRLSQGIEGNRWKTLDINIQTGFLSQAEQALLISHISSGIPATRNLTAYRRQLRDRAMVAVYLGSGLKVHQALAMTVSCIDFSSAPQITIQEKGSKFIHQVRLLPFAASVLSRWLAERLKWALECSEKNRDVGDLAFPGEIVDPGNLKTLRGEGRPEAPPANASMSWIDSLENEKPGDAGSGGTRLIGKSMNSTTALRICEAVVRASGVYDRRRVPAGETDPERISPQTLRNSFAAALFASGETTLSVTGQLGFADEVSAVRLKAAWDSWRKFGEKP